MISVVLFALGLALAPQSARPAVPPAQVPQTVPVTAPPVADPQIAAPTPPPAVSGISVRHRRDQIGVMEGVLSAAVRLGASQIAREMQASGPGPAILVGQPRARGFILDGYGVFFNVFRSSDNILNRLIDFFGFHRCFLNYLIQNTNRVFGTFC